MTIGTGVWSAQCRPTDPITLLRSGPRPRVPITSSIASRAAWTSAMPASPWTTIGSSWGTSASDVFCVGKNYFAHANEFHSSGFDSSGKEAVPSAPIIFTKATTSIVGPDAVVRGSLDPTQTVDYEGELGVILGTRAFQVPKDKAYDQVFGYVVMNDVTSRELQRHHNQWVIGKGIDTFCPMGPYIVTSDEVGDVTKLVLETEINSEPRQKASVADLIFDIPTLIETMSATMTLLPGDIIATGTPDGVGIGFKPPKYLAKGDRMSVRITGLGELNNTIG